MENARDIAFRIVRKIRDSYPPNESLDWDSSVEGVKLNWDNLNIETCGVDALCDFASNILFLVEKKLEEQLNEPSFATEVEAEAFLFRVIVRYPYILDRLRDLGGYTSVGMVQQLIRNNKDVFEMKKLEREIND